MSAPASSLRRVVRAVWRVLRGMLLALAAVVIFIEEWGWQPLSAWLARFGRWPPVRRLEARIATVPPRWALVLFLVPAVLLFPLKLLALWLIHLGRPALGIGVIVAAKLLGTALVGRLFVLTEPQLMGYAWFARTIAWWRDVKVQVRTALRTSGVSGALQRVRQRWRAWWQRHAPR